MQYNWIFSIAVPAFLLVSALLYGLKDDDKPKGTDFLLKRFKSVAIVYYPFIISVFLFYAIWDSANLLQYLKSLIGDLLFLCDFVKPLPGCGHLWFMQTLAMCYIALAVASQISFVRRWFQSVRISLVLLAVLIALGFIYRGAYLVYIFFYLWTYFNAFKIQIFISKRRVLLLIMLLLIGYLLLSTHYSALFHVGFYVMYIQTCVMAILTIIFFMSFFERVKEIRIITGLGAIAMEFYLIHHLFVFDQPLYISLPLTLFLSVVLHYTVSKTQYFVFNKNTAKR
jgi:hypothetical protein